MFDYNLYVPISLYKEMDAVGQIKNEDTWLHPATAINIDAFNKKREIWNEYIRTAKRPEIFKIGSVVTYSRDSLPRNVYVIVDIIFDRYGIKPEIKKDTKEVEFEYEIMHLGNIRSYEQFKKTGEVIRYYNNFYIDHSDIPGNADRFDSVVCTSLEEYFRIFDLQNAEVKRTLVKKRFMGYNATNSYGYDYSDSRYTFKIKDVCPAYGIMSFVLVPEDGYTVIMKKSKGSRDDYYDVFIKEKRESLPFELIAHINPDTDRLEFSKGGFVYSEKKTVTYISSMFARGYKYMSHRDGFDYKKIVKDEFIMPRILFPDDNWALKVKFRKFFEAKQLCWDQNIIGKKIAGIAESDSQRWIMFSDKSFIIQKAKKTRGEKYYKTVTESVIDEFGSIHGFFSAMLSKTKKDHLNNFGELFRSNEVFKKDEIISVSKSDI